MPPVDFFKDYVGGAGQIQVDCVGRNKNFELTEDEAFPHTNTL